jgi:phospholipase/carboxylesterase
MSGLIHCVRLPASAEGSNLAPVVVMVHGWGGDESVMWVFKNVVSAEAAIITPRAPLDLDGEGYIWFQRDEAGVADPASQLEAIHKFEHFITTLPDLYPIDPERLLLIGFSQGGAMCNTLAMTRPELIRGVASLASFVPKLPESVPTVSSVNRLPVFIAHGTKDDIVPVEEGRRTRQTYEQLGAEITYGEYEVRHKMSSQGIKELQAWVQRVIGD